jgi:SAM-dependent methyltransferase
MARIQNLLFLMRGLSTRNSRQLIIDVLHAVDEAPEHECPCCSYVGRFLPYPSYRPPLFDVECPSCGSYERHRLFTLVQRRHQIVRGSDRVLHFAAEKAIQNLVKPIVAEYKTADLRPEAGDMVLNIEDIALPSASLDVAICSHVLEHVDDRRALSELHRILSPGGRLIIMVPVCEGWDTTYENPSIVSEADRVLHFSQSDHVRYYGRDLRDRIRAPGFELVEYVASGPETVRHGLLRGERVFVAVKRGS